MIAPSRRHVLGGLCACSMFGLSACNATTGNDPPLAAGYRPASNTDEGGLWHGVEKIERETARSRYRIQDAELNKYLEEIIARLSPEFHADMRVYLLRTPHFNASMYPNGMMNVWTGLMLRAQDEAQLAAVLGHEIGHYTKRHSVARFRDARSRADFGIFLGMGLAAAGAGAVGDLANLMMVAGQFAYSREHEREADEVGISLMAKAGYRTVAASEVWQQVIDESEADKNYRRPNLMFASHPAPEERMHTLRTRAEELGNSGERFVERYRRKISAIRFMMLEDEVRLRQYASSLVLLQRLQKEMPGDGELIYFEAEVYRLRGSADDVKLAESTYERAALTANAPPQTWRSLGLIQRRDGRHDAAVQSFKKYLDLRPNAEDRAIITSYMEKTV